jgi:hypothetical protein
LFYEISRKQQRAENSNMRKYFSFSIQMGKAWHFILKSNQRKSISISDRRFDQLSGGTRMSRLSNLFALKLLRHLANSV